VDILTTVPATDAPERLTPDEVPARLVEMSPDVRAAVLLDAAGAPVAQTEGDTRLAELAAGLFPAADKGAPGGPPQQLEVQVAGGAVYASRTPRWTLVAVARRQALSSLMLFDLDSMLDWLEGGPPIRRAKAAEEPPAQGPDTDEAAAAELPLPELGE
jgi:hypothetical protein